VKGAAVPGEAIKALGDERDALLEVCAGLSEGDWYAPSGCPGWSTKDVVAHLGALFWAAVDPSVLPDVSGLPTERAQDILVESRRSWSAERVRADYESVSAQALGLLASLEGVESEVPLGDLGTYPAHVLPKAFCFDHYLHIRSDLFSPRGSLAGPPPSSDALRLAVAVDWTEAALPQQNAELIGSLKGSVAITLDGPAPRLLRIGAGHPTAAVTSDAASFLRWITHRASWAESGAKTDGDGHDLALVQQLRVF
jgi:uncharacterized protein (TIGR03083 family)